MKEFFHSIGVPGGYYVHRSWAWWKTPDESFLKCYECKELLLFRHLEMLTTVKTATEGKVIFQGTHHFCTECVRALPATADLFKKDTGENVEPYQP